MKRVDLIRAIEGLGCEFVWHGGQHASYRNPPCGAARLLLTGTEDGISSVEGTAMPLIHCETRPGLRPGQTVAGVTDVYGHRHFMLVDHDFLTAHDGTLYLPVGVVFRDRDKGVALIEFAEEADSGAWRAWVSLADLVEKSETPA